jgi:hypothetical protein
MARKFLVELIYLNITLIITHHYYIPSYYKLLKTYRKMYRRVIPRRNISKTSYSKHIKKMLYRRAIRRSRVSPVQRRTNATRPRMRGYIRRGACRMATGAMWKAPTKLETRIPNGTRIGCSPSPIRGPHARSSVATTAAFIYT